jgi:hypothetical protein
MTFGIGSTKMTSHHCELFSASGRSRATVGFLTCMSLHVFLKVMCTRQNIVCTHGVLTYVNSNTSLEVSRVKELLCR